MRRLPLGYGNTCTACVSSSMPPGGVPMRAIATGLIHSTPPQAKPGRASEAVGDQRSAWQGVGIQTPPRGSRLDVDLPKHGGSIKAKKLRVRSHAWVRGCWCFRLCGGGFFDSGTSTVSSGSKPLHIAPSVVRIRARGILGGGGCVHPSRSSADDRRPPMSLPMTADLLRDHGNTRILPNIWVTLIGNTCIIIHTVLCPHPFLTASQVSVLARPPDDARAQRPSGRWGHSDRLRRRPKAASVG